VDIIDNILGMVAKHYKLDSFMPRLDAINNLGKGKGLEVPDELVALNVDMLSRSLYNIMAIQPNNDWVWPYWAEKQYDQTDKSFLPSSYLSINLTHRNWTGLSSPSSDREAIVDPRGLVTPLFDGWSLDYWVKRDDLVILPSRLESLDQRLVNRSPIVKSTFYKKNVKVISEALMFEADGENYVEAFYHVEPWENVKTRMSFYLAVRPYNPESVVPVRSIEYLKGENAFKVNGKDLVYLDVVPDRVVCSNQDAGDSYFRIDRPEAGDVLSAEDPSGLCNAFAEFSREVGSNTPFTLKAVLSQRGKAVPEAVVRARHSRIRGETIGVWTKRKEGALKIRTPDSRINEAFEASVNNLLVLVDKTEVTPGPFTYHKMWFRDAAYSVTALLKLGFTADAKRILENYFKKQTADGYFESQNGEWDSNGQVLWTVCQYYFFTRDREFIETHYRSLERGAEWVFKTRKKLSKDRADLHAGLLPPGYSAEHFGPSNYYYWDDFWAYGGVRDFIAVSRELGRDSGALERENAAFMEDIERSIARTKEKLGEQYLPGSPYRRKDCSLIGTLVALYPLQLFPPDREDLRATLRLIRKQYMDSGAFFHKLLHSGYNVYLTAHMAECYLLQKAALALPILDWILDHASGTWTFPEAIHPETGGGCMGDGHHGWATSELVHLIRNLLFMERDGRLSFFPAIPQRWLDIGNVVEAKDARSHFGTFDFSLSSESDSLVFRMDSDFASPPEAIELNMPVKMTRVVVGGTERAVDDRSVLIPYGKRIEARIFI
jgi:hypothetical protein